MANRVKTISKYSGSAWGTEVPIGADATNVDMTSNPSDYDSSSSETSKVLIGTNDVKVISNDTDLTAWGKFNRFRRRVSNKFADYFTTSNIKTAYQTTGADSTVYSTSLLNSYFSNVIGYTGSSAPTAGSVASQLESLNNNLDDLATTTNNFITLCDNNNIELIQYRRAILNNNGGNARFYCARLIVFVRYGNVGGIIIAAPGDSIYFSDATVRSDFQYSLNSDNIQLVNVSTNRNYRYDAFVLLQDS